MMAKNIDSGAYYSDKEKVNKNPKSKHEPNFHKNTSTWKDKNIQ
jgi:hypothetical protein